MPSIGPMELVIVLVIALLVVGPRSCPRSGAPSAAGCASSRTPSAVSAMP